MTGWQIQRSGHDAPVTNLTAVDAHNAWAGTTAGVLRTQDGGVTWTQVGAETLSTSAKVQFLDVSNGWAITESDVLSTADGGESWSVNTAVRRPPQFWVGLSFISPTHGWVVDFNGLLARTTDGGATWTEHLIPAATAPKIAFINATFGWAGVSSPESRRVFTTADGGATWQERLVLPPGSVVDALDAISPTTAWVAVRSFLGPGGYEVHRTVNGGATWTVGTIQGAESVGDMDFVDATHGWVVGDGIHHSSDGGATWTAQTLPDLGGSHFVSGVAFINSTTGWAGGAHGEDGSSGFILKTTTGGE